MQVVKISGTSNIIAYGSSQKNSPQVASKKELSKNNNTSNYVIGASAAAAVAIASIAIAGLKGKGPLKKIFKNNIKQNNSKLNQKTESHTEVIKPKANLAQEAPKAEAKKPETNPVQENTQPKPISLEKALPYEDAKALSDKYNTVGEIQVNKSNVNADNNIVEEGIISYKDGGKAYVATLKNQSKNILKQDFYDFNTGKQTHTKVYGEDKKLSKIVLYNDNAQPVRELGYNKKEQLDSYADIDTERNQIKQIISYKNNKATTIHIDKNNEASISK